MVQIEIDLYALHKAQAEGESKGRPGLVRRKVKVHRGSKTFEQYRWVKSGKDEPKERKGAAEEPVEKPKKELAIMGLNKPKEETKEKTEEKPEKKPAKIIKVGTEDLSKRMGFFKDGLKFHPDGSTMIDLVEEYTGTDYGLYNEYLRKGEYGKGSKSGMNESMDKKIDHISSFLKNAPKMGGVVFRGMSFYKDEKDAIGNFDKFLSQIERGEPFLLKSFTSTSTDEKVATEFTKTDKAHTIIFEIKSKSGVYLNGMSQLPKENEVLFDKDSKFKIQNVDKSGYPEHVKIVMEEI